MVIFLLLTINILFMRIFLINLILMPFILYLIIKVKYGCWIFALITVLSLLVFPTEYIQPTATFLVFCNIIIIFITGKK